jgi:hypothetical protein
VQHARAEDAATGVQPCVSDGALPNSRVRWAAPWAGGSVNGSRPQAARALREHAADFGHRLFGLPAPARDAKAAGDLRPGAAERVAVGPIVCELIPRALDTPAVTVVW